MDTEDTGFYNWMVSGVPLPGRGGGIGRHAALRALWPHKAVGVRVSSSAPRFRMPTAT